MSAAGASSQAEPVPAKAPAPWGRRGIPDAGPGGIFGRVFWRIPLTKVGDALRDVPITRFVAIFLPYSLYFFVIDSFCLTWVVRRFNAPLSWGEILPIRASMYLLAMINTNLGQGGV